MNEGWKCPNCGKAHAPDVKTCPDPRINPWSGYPMSEEALRPFRRCGCTSSAAVCNSTVCPYRVEITC